LNHEAFDDAVKTGAVVKALFGERLEILDGLGRDLGPEFDDHFAFGGVDDGDFVGVCGSAHGCVGWGVGFGFVSQSRHHSSGKDDGANQVKCFHGREIFQTRGQKSRAELAFQVIGGGKFLSLSFLGLFLRVLVLSSSLCSSLCSSIARVMRLAWSALPGAQHENRQTARHRQNCHAYGQSTFPAIPELSGGGAAAAQR
jgi:hypothetical protein